MDETLKPSRFVGEIALLLDDNVRVSIETALAFERALIENPSDPATRGAYHDWLLDNDCTTRATQLREGITDQTPGEYTGVVRPDQVTYPLNWAGLCGAGPPDAAAEWLAGFNVAMQTMAFWLDFRSAARRREKPHLSVREVDMRKSALLGRLMRGEEVRRRPCPRHQGVMWCSWGFDAQRCVCEGTGWLANDYTGPMPSPKGE